jgi:hypothetical protein
MHADRADHDRPAILVVSRVADELHIGRDPDLLVFELEVVICF